MQRKADTLASSVHGRTPMTVAREMGGDELFHALEAALWPLAQRRCSPIIRGPLAMELVQRTSRIRWETLRGVPMRDRLRRSGPSKCCQVF